MTTAREISDVNHSTTTYADLDSERATAFYRNIGVAEELVQRLHAQREDDRRRAVAANVDHRASRAYFELVREAIPSTGWPNKKIEPEQLTLW